jgi:hypothetical protein
VLNQVPASTAGAVAEAAAGAMAGAVAGAVVVGSLFVQPDTKMPKQTAITTVNKIFLIVSDFSLATFFFYFYSGIKMTPFLSGYNNKIIRFEANAIYCFSARFIE